MVAGPTNRKPELALARLALALVVPISSPSAVTTGTAIPVAAGITTILANGSTILRSVRHPKREGKRFGTKIKDSLKKEPKP